MTRAYDVSGGRCSWTASTCASGTSPRCAATSGSCPGDVPLHRHGRGESCARRRRPRSAGRRSRARCRPRTRRRSWSALPGGLDADLASAASISRTGSASCWPSPERSSIIPRPRARRGDLERRSGVRALIRAGDGAAHGGTNQRDHRASALHHPERGPDPRAPPRPRCARRARTPSCSRQGGLYARLWEFGAGVITNPEGTGEPCSVDGFSARSTAWCGRFRRGRVVTYGQIAAMLGLAARGARGGRRDADTARDDVPWHRVVNAQGGISRRAKVGSMLTQRILLEQEGVPVRRGRVPLAQYRWRPTAAVRRPALTAARAGRRSSMRLGAEPRLLRLGHLGSTSHHGPGGGPPRLPLGVVGGGLRLRRGDAHHVGRRADRAHPRRHGDHADPRADADADGDDRDDARRSSPAAASCLGLGVSGPQVVEGWHGVALRQAARQDARVRRDRPRGVAAREAGRVHAASTTRSRTPGRTPPASASRSRRSCTGAPTSRSISPPSDPRTWPSPPRSPTAGSPSSSRPAHALFQRVARGGLRPPAAASRCARFDVTPTVPVVVGDDVAACRAAVKPRLALYVGGMGARGRNFYNDLVRRYGYEDAAQRIQDSLPRRARRRRPPRRCRTRSSTRSRCAGPRERIRERLAEWKSSGVTTLMVRATRRGANDGRARLC